MEDLTNEKSVIYLNGVCLKNTNNRYLRYLYLNDPFKFLSFTVPWKLNISLPYNVKSNITITLFSISVLINIVNMNFSNKC